MARVTVEDCIDKVENRFELVLLAAHRSREISNGYKPAVERDNDKNPVVSLREIAERGIDPGDLKDRLINSLQKHVEVDEPENVPLLMSASDEADEQEKTDGSEVPMTEEALLKKMQEMKPPDQMDEA